MSINTIREHTGRTDELHEALIDMTGAVSTVEASFTPWDTDQLVELEYFLGDMAGLDRLDRAIQDLAA